MRESRKKHHELECEKTHLGEINISKVRVDYEYFQHDFGAQFSAPRVLEEIRNPRLLGF
jgi:CHAD domain-containing protein